MSNYSFWGNTKVVYWLVTRYAVRYKNSYLRPFLLVKACAYQKLHPGKLRLSSGHRTTANGCFLRQHSSFTINSVDRQGHRCIRTFRTSPTSLYQTRAHRVEHKVSSNQALIKSLYDSWPVAVRKQNLYRMNWYRFRSYTAVLYHQR